MSFARLSIHDMFVAFLFFGIAMFAVASSVSAQQQQPGNAQQRIQRPVNKNMPVALDPELKNILQNWEKAGEFTKKMEGKHYRYIFDNVFKVQKIAQGEFYYETPDKGRIDLNTPKGLKEGQEIERNGLKYKVKKDSPQRWVCDGTQVFVVDEERKEFQRLPIPAEKRGQNIVDGPLPFLFGLSMEKMLMRYNITLFTPAMGGQNNQQAGIIHLKVKPLWKQDATNWQEAEVMLNAKDYLPKAIRLKHPGGNSETVYVFYDVKRNAQKRLIGRIWGNNPFAPSLRGYKELVTAAKPELNNQLRKK